MNNKNWNEIIKNNFDNAASNYLEYSNIQRFFSGKVVSFIKELNTQNGEWIDLGSGTGLLADKIEKEFSPEDKHYDLESEYPDEIHQLHKKMVFTDIEYFYYKPKNFKMK